MPAVRGVVHVAGVMVDATLEHQTVDSFERAFAPKVMGGWNMHVATLEADVKLDFFVLFSSTSALLGYGARSSYAAANSVLDGVAHLRRSQGLPALSVQWGPWATAGMAAENDTMRRLEKQGVKGISEELGLDALSSLMRHSDSSLVTHAVVVPAELMAFMVRPRPLPGCPVVELCFPQQQQ